MSQNYEYFGKYILLEKIATGGMAEVWLARSPSTAGIGRFVAIKKILAQFSDNPEFLQMFKDEAAIAMNLSHSNIVSIFEFGQEKSQLFLVMDYVEGRNLRQILNKMKAAQQKFSFDQIIYVIKEVAAGLDHAHRSLNSATGNPLNITHRDMSPQNVMVSFEGEVKIVDFGIAKAEMAMESTKAGTLKGKFGYMSPEQAEGQQTDLRTDIFSLGIILWELLANDRLFIANNEINTLRKIRDCQVPSLTKINPNVSPELERIVQKALTRDRNLRYQTAAAFHRDLNRYLNRQYPDFSPHDFSVFIKTLYTDEILKNRKKLIEYSKTNFKPPKVSEDKNDKTLVTGPSLDKATSGSLQVPPTLTQTETFSKFDSDSSESNSTAVSSEKIKIEVTDSNKSSILDFSKLEKNLDSKIKVNPTAPTPIESETGTGNAPLETSLQSITGSSYKGLSKEMVKRRAKLDSRNSPSKPKRVSERSGRLLPFFILSFLLGASYYAGLQYFPEETAQIENSVKEIVSSLSDQAKTLSSEVISQSREPVVQPEPIIEAPSPEEESQSSTLTEETTSEVKPDPSVALVGIIINSQPSGAEIFIDGKKTGKSTPSRIEIPENKRFLLTLKKDEYIDYTKSGATTSNLGNSFTATLQSAMVGYIDIDASPARNVLVYVNGKPLRNEVLPITRYAVPAGVPIEVRVESLTTGASASETLTLRESQRKSVRLRLNR